MVPDPQLVRPRLSEADVDKLTIGTVRLNASERTLRAIEFETTLDLVPQRLRRADKRSRGVRRVPGGRRAARARPEPEFVVDHVGAEL